MEYPPPQQPPRRPRSQQQPQQPQPPLRRLVEVTLDLADALELWAETTGLREAGPGPRLLVELDRRFRSADGPRMQIASVPLTLQAVLQLTELLREDVDRRA